VTKVGTQQEILPNVYFNTILALCHNNILGLSRFRLYSTRLACYVPNLLCGAHALFFVWNMRSKSGRNTF
jgi:hypothetical protein